MIFPVTESQSNGIEDARFVEFEDGGKTTYFATYTAYSGKAIRSELIETPDFLSFRMSPLMGAAAKNKGMALFPRRIDGRYAMIARQDNENLYLVYSDDLHSIGAVLLDKIDPSKVLARTREPLIRPEPSERQGYVPNVVYTCGAMRHKDQIILPYAVSDTFSNFATIKISTLMSVLNGCSLKDLRIAVNH